jgi:hypothetical protein
MTYTKSELIGAICELASRVDDESPTAIQMNDHPDLPYADTFRRNFGSWNSALIEAGYEPNRRYQVYEDTESPNQYYERVKNLMQCVACGVDDYACIEFHHLDDGAKEFALSKTTHLSVDKADVYAEFYKCVPLCANCHKRHHSNRHDFSAQEYSIPEYPEPED